MGNIYYQGFDKVIVYEKISLPVSLIWKPKLPEKFCKNFPTTVSGWLLLEISKSMKVSMKDFIFESNKTRHINFVETLEEALVNFSK
jgi:hypothetical protein